MSDEHRDIWWRTNIEKYGSKEAVLKMLSENAKKNGFKPGNVPANKIKDQYTNLPLTRQEKYKLRKRDEQND